MNLSFPIDCESLKADCLTFAQCLALNRSPTVRSTRWWFLSIPLMYICFVSYTSYYPRVAHDYFFHVSFSEEKIKIQDALLSHWRGKVTVPPSLLSESPIQSHLQGSTLAQGTVHCVFSTNLYTYKETMYNRDFEIRYHALSTVYFPGR